MKFRYLLVNDYGDTFGTDDPALARDAWDSGDYLVIDVERGMTYEEGEVADLEMTPIPALEAEPPEGEDEDDEDEDALA